MNKYLEEFLDVKELEGCSPATLKSYKFNIEKFLIKINKDPLEITTQDIRNYLSNYKKDHKIENIALDNMRRIYASFFRYLHREGYIQKDSCAAVNKYK